MIVTKTDFAEFNTETERLRNIEWKGYKNTLREVGISYLGNVGVSSKLRHSEEYSLVNTYGVYLSPNDELTGFNVCPSSKYCKANCLNGSGHNKIDRLAHRGDIDRARIIKTRLFFVNRPVFMQLLIHEIKKEMRRARIQGHFFAVRLNCVSDISPLAFTLNRKNILQIFPNIVFYDYTKVENRLELPSRFANYDITWSIDGSKVNREIGLEWLERGGKVAVVYGEDDMPKSWYGYRTHDGDLTDYRPNDSEQVCMLKFKKTAHNYKNGKFIMPNTKFIVTKADKNVEW